MRIETDKYLITTDKYNFIAQIKSVVKDTPLLKDKSLIGTESLGEKNFYPTLEKVYEGIIKHTLFKEDLENLADVKTLIEELIEEVKGLK